MRTGVVSAASAASALGSVQHVAPTGRSPKSPTSHGLCRGGCDCSGDSGGAGVGEAAGTSFVPAKSEGVVSLADGAPPGAQAVTASATTVEMARRIVSIDYLLRAAKGCAGCLRIGGRRGSRARLGSAQRGLRRACVASSVAWHYCCSLSLLGVGMHLTRRPGIRHMTY